MKKKTTKYDDSVFESEEEEQQFQKVLPEMVRDLYRQTVEGIVKSNMSRESKIDLLYLTSKQFNHNVPMEEIVKLVDVFQ